MKACLLLEECQKRDVPEQSYTWYAVEPSNTKPFEDTMRLEFEGRLWHAGWMDGSLLPILTLNSGMCQRTKHRHRKAPTMTLSKSSRPADYPLMSNLI